MMFKRIAPALALLAFAVPAAAQTLASGGSGPWPAIAEVDPTLPRHVVYRPAQLPTATGQKLGVLVWGNGACSDNSEMHAAYLLEIASHGYLVLANGFSPEEAKRRAAERPQQSPAERREVPTTVKDMIDGVDWALAQDGDRSSRYAGKIDHSAIAAAGHSCGGVQALEVGFDPRVQTVIGNNTGVFPDDTPKMTGMMLEKADLKKLHAPVLYLQGGETDIAYANGMDDYRQIGHVPVAIVNLPVGHGGTFDQPNGGIAASISVDWLDWQLRGDAAAGRSFAGDNCRLCNGAEWQFEKKGF